MFLYVGIAILVSVPRCWHCYTGERSYMLALLYWRVVYMLALLYSGADPGFQVRGAHLKKLRQAEGGMKFLGYFV